MSLRIMLSGGGTAGSVAPLLAVVEYMRKLDVKIEWMFVGTADGPERSLAEVNNIPYQEIAAGKLRRYWSWANLGDIGKIWRGFRQSQKIIGSWKPDVILSAGSYVSVPLVWAGRMAGKRILVHQQDIVPGLANRMMVRAASRITVSFESSMRSFPKQKTTLVGNPVRADVLQGNSEKGRQLFQLDQRTPVLLVIGGSTGSQFLNGLIGAVGYRLVKHWQIIHITGRNRDYVELQDDRYHRYDFLSWEFPHALATANLVVSRAGLGLISELAAVGKPTIFVPMPDTHQEPNAAMIARLKAGVVKSQKELNPAKFFETIESLRTNKDWRDQLSRNIAQLYRPNAVTEISKIVLDLAKK